ncbi:S-layer homology domain-containing protein [Cohnella hongkongensis]|uniref:S-layer homology domain-containing protein n=1 Tax=Cohnella hongkongensis TaxID=178337 RepID=A0ABV9F635_9BACL
MTELKTEDTGYNYLEFYNNSDKTINFAFNNVFYEYPSGLSYRHWTLNASSLPIESGRTLVVWINNDGKTVEQFNQHYGVNLEENKSIIKVDYSGMSPDVERTIKLGNVYENPIVVATYHEDELDDTSRTASIHYTYSRDNGIRMAKADIDGPPTPGTVAPWQVPSERVPFDYYGGFPDDPSTMVLKPRDEIPPSIDEGEALNVAFDLYDTGTGVHTIETYYKFDDEPTYRVKMEKRQRIPKQLITSIPASEFLGHDRVSFYIRAYNAFRHYDTAEYTVLIRRSPAADGVELNVETGRIVSGTLNLKASAAEDESAELRILIDGQEQAAEPALDGDAFFAYRAEGLTSYYKNAITVGGDVIKLLSSWANVHQKAARIDSSRFTPKADGDYEVTVTLRAGTEGSPFEASGVYAPFTMSQMALYLPDGTFLYPDNGIAYNNAYVIGDSASTLDVHFTIPKEKLKAKGMRWDTRQLADGEHTISAVAASGSKHVVVTVDNAAPVVDPGIGEGQTLRSGDVVSPSAHDEGSGIDAAGTEATLNGRSIPLPYAISGRDLTSGAYTLEVLYTDHAGHAARKSVNFHVDVSAPSVTVGEAGPSTSTSVSLSVRAEGTAERHESVEFKQARRLSVQNGGIRVYSGAGDYPLAAGGADSLISISGKGLPYQLFEIETGEVTDEDLVEAVWEGGSDANGTLRMFLLNRATDRWEPVAEESQGRIEVVFKAGDYVQNGKAMLLVQNRSEGSHPSADRQRSPVGGADPSGTGAYEWDGTGVPDRYDFSFAWITDQQYYVESWPSHYTEMNRWILDNRERFDIRYTINTGDLVDEWDRDEQWQIADAAQRILDEAGMPNGVLAGNHDVASGNEEYDSYWQYFGEHRYRDNSYYGGSYRNNLGHYDLISAGGQDFIIVYASWDVYQDEIDWMNEVLAKYPERKAILALHRYLKQGGTLDYTGELVQKEVVAKNPNVFAVLNGHYFGAAIKIDGFDDDGDGIQERKVYQICTDYQGAAEGGLQYLKMIYFDLDNDKVYMNAYSPYLNDFNYFDSPKLAAYDVGVTASSQDIYELDVPFDTNAKTLSTTSLKVDVYTNLSIGTGRLSSGEAVHVWEGLTPDTSYGWYAQLVNDMGEVTRTSIAEARTLSGGGAGTAPLITSAVPGDGYVRLAWAPAAESVSYSVYASTVSGLYDQPVVTVASSVYRHEVTGLTNGTLYYFTVQAETPNGVPTVSNEASATPIGVPGAPTGVTAAAGNGMATVSFAPPHNDGGSPILQYVVTANPGGIQKTGTGTTISVGGLTNGTAYTFTVRAVNRAGSGPESAVSPSVTPYSPSSGSGNPGPTPPADPAEPGPIEPTGPVQPGTADFAIALNGKSEAIATAVTTEEGLRRVTTITLDDGKTERALALTERRAQMIVPFPSDTDIAVLSLSGQTLKKLEARDDVLVIETEKGSYTLPAALIGLERLAAQLDAQDSLQDLNVKMTVAAPSKETEGRIEQAALQAGYRPAAKPIKFTITASSGGQTVEAIHLDGYAEKWIALPAERGRAGMTAVAVRPDGAFVPVPTSIVVRDGIAYARINSLYNGTFLVVESVRTFADTENHWARSAIHELGSRLVIDGVGDDRFEPNRSITRAEFAAVLVRALGLMQSEAGQPVFRDVGQGAWYSEAVSVAYSYGLVNGAGGGNFRPSDRITREEAMTLIARAMSAAGVRTDFAASEIERELADYRDSSQVGAWARPGVAAVLKAGIVSGRSETELAPKDEISRAETAVLLLRLLRHSGLLS